MKEKNDVLNNRLYIITTYICNFFVINFWFLVMIAPFLFYLYNFQGSISIPILLLISIVIGPALATLFSVNGRLVRDGEVSPTKDFFHFYKLNFFQGLLIGIILNSFIGMLYFDMNYFSLIGDTYLSYLFLFLIVIFIMLGFYIYPIISRYNVKTVHLIKISTKLLVKKMYISLSCISMIIIVLALIRITGTSLIGLLFGASIICYLIMKIERKAIDELEDEIKEQYRDNCDA
ncbi:DUF624 domain-containing protein [Clostridium sp.]|uniref:DUF624 domain-containing protein n=1 Tax=Clostridium sp. TaxID=1506 RepID=UPI002844E007|nr:DUF624 domain-containing protein [Clostridium sp.]MDR3593761.1 DUF624 domain-containing protein [Clostridium sp.]